MVELDRDPVQYLVASCDKSNQSEELLKAGNSDCTSSTGALCGSETNSLNGVNSPEPGFASLDSTHQGIDENDNIDTGYSGFSHGSTRHWGDQTDSRSEPSLSHHTEDSEARETTSDVRNFDHDYSRGDYSKDPDLLSWYCLNTC